MSKLQKAWVIFCAEYLVLVEGLLFLVCIYQSGGFTEQITTTLEGGMLLIVALTCAKMLKKLIRKRRPLKRSELFVPFDRYAFPSAHSASLFALTTFILSQHLLLGIMSLIVTVLIVVARVNARVHDYIDIAGGFVIGVGVTYYLSPYVIVYVTTYLVPTLLSRI
jgi:membrane-associated phospholipid phosphatase